MGDILNNLTKSQLDELKLKLEFKKARKDINCLWCEKLIKKALASQRFCCNNCRASYHNAALQVQYENLLVEKERWIAERSELVKEIGRLSRLLNIPEILP